MQRTRTLTAVLAILAVLTVAGAVGLADVAHAAPSDSATNSSSDGNSGEHSAEKNEIMQLVLEDPGNLSVEQRRKVVAWLLSPGNLDKLSEADRQAVRTWLSKAEEQGVTIPSRDAVERALDNAAASQPTNQQNQSKNYDESCESRISPALCVTNVTWTGDGQVVMTFKADYPHQITITDSGYIIAADRGTGSQVPTKTVTVSSGLTRVGMDVTNPSRSPPVVTVGASGQLYVFKSPSGGSLWAFITDPSTDLIQYALISGAIGAILDVAAVLAFLKRREKHKWYDLAREKYISRPFVRGDPEDDRIERARKTVAAHKWRATVTLVVGAYAAAVLLGHAPAPNEVWNGLGNRTRLVALGTGIAAAISAVPVYVIITYWRDSTHVYLVDFDAEDAVDATLGDDDGRVGMYRGTPALASDLEVTDGSTTKLRTTEGRCILATNFDPAHNEAEGSLPELHDDRKIAIEGKSAIHSNKRHLKDEVQNLQQLLYRVVGISVAAETQSARRVATEVEEHLSAHSTVAGDQLEEIFDDEEREFTEAEEKQHSGSDDGDAAEDTPDGE